MSKNKQKKTLSARRLETSRLRLSVNKSISNLFIQVIDDKTNKTIASESTINYPSQTKSEDAKLAGINLAKKLKSKKNVSSLYLMRSGKYVGRLKVFCETLRDNGIDL